VFSIKDEWFKLAYNDFRKYASKEKTLTTETLLKSMESLSPFKTPEYNFFVIPDGNARTAFLELPSVSKTLQACEKREWRECKTILSKKIAYYLQHSEEYVANLRKEYKRNAFASSLLVREARKISFGDAVTCIYNEVNVNDRVYFDIFEKTLSEVGRENVQLLEKAGIKSFAVGSDAEEWAKKIDGLHLLDRKPEKNESRAIVVCGLYSKTSKALSLLEKEFKEINKEKTSEIELMNLFKQAIGEIIDERLEKYARPMHALLRPTHMRLSGMYSTIYNDTPLGFTFLPLRKMHPASLALQLVAAREADVERVDKHLDVYQPEAYRFWNALFNEDYSKNFEKIVPREFNAVLPCKRIPPLFTKITAWKLDSLKNAVKNFYKLE